MGLTVCTSPGGTLDSDQLGGASATDSIDSGLVLSNRCKLETPVEHDMGAVTYQVKDNLGIDAVGLVHDVKDNTAVALELVGEFAPP